MRIVTLTTDWHKADYYVGSLKAALLSVCPEVTVVDISHQIAPFNRIQAAMILRNSYTHFPKGSIHIIGVHSEPSPSHKLAVMYANEHYFIAPNDGTLNLLTPHSCPESIYEFPIPEAPGGFKALTLFCEAVSAILAEDLENTGTSCELQQAWNNLPNYNADSITGQIIYIDSFGNAISNISRELFEKIHGGRKFELLVQSRFNIITRISEFYDEVQQGEILALFNSIGLLEIAVNQGNVAQLENLDTTSHIKIKFLE